MSILHDVARCGTIRGNVVMTKLSFSLTPNSLNKLQIFEIRLSEHYNALKNVEEKELTVLRKYACISNIGGSTRIENARLTDVEIQWIDTVLTASGKQTAFAENKMMIEDKLSKDRERSIEEVGGCREMLLTILQEYEHLQPLRETDIRHLHDVLLRYYPKADSYKGQYKTQPNSVVLENHATGEKRTIFKTADAGPITAIAMQDLIDWYNVMYISDLRTLAITVEFVFRFLAIHPSLNKLTDTAVSVLNCFQENPGIRLARNKICTMTELPVRTVNNVITRLLEGQLIQKYGQGSATSYQLTF